MIIRFGALPNNDAVSPVSDVRQLICSVHRTVSLCSFKLDSPCDRRQWSTQLKFLHGYETFSISSAASLQTTRNSAIADKPARRVYRSVKVTKHSRLPFHMLDIVSYCAIVTLSLRRAVFTIFYFKKVVTLKLGSEVTQGQWKWHNSIDCVWFPISVL